MKNWADLVANVLLGIALAFLLQTISLIVFGPWMVSTWALIAFGCGVASLFFGMVSRVIG